MIVLDHWITVLTTTASSSIDIVMYTEYMLSYTAYVLQCQVIKINIGLKILEHACGDSMRVVTHRLNNHATILCIMHMYCSGSTYHPLICMHM